MFKYREVSVKRTADCCDLSQKKISNSEIYRAKAYPVHQTRVHQPPSKRKRSYKNEFKVRVAFSAEVIVVLKNSRNLAHL